MGKKASKLRSRLQHEGLQSHYPDNQADESVQNIFSLRTFVQKTFIQIFLIVASCIIVYLPNLSHQFVYDDSKFFITWQTPKSFENIPYFFQGYVPEGHAGVYRPVRTLFYAIDYKFWGENPLGYHLQAILVNALIALLVYFIVRKITENYLMAFGAGMLFGLHPVHTETITFATASMDAIGFVFAFASFYLYLIARRKKSWKFFFSIVLAFLAFFTYELTLVLPFLYLFYELCFSKKRSLKNSFFIALPYIMGIVLYGFIRMGLNIGTRHSNYLADNIFLTWITMLKIFYQYITILIFPFNLSLDHTVARGIGSLKIEKDTFFSQSVVDLGTFITIVLILSLLFFMYKCFKKYPLVTFCIGWFFIALIPVSNFIIPIQHIFAERYLYFASFGFCLFVAYALFGKFSPKNVFYRKIVLVRSVIFIVLVVSYVLMTFYRNSQWKDSTTLWSVTAKQSPYSGFAWNNLGLAYHNDGQLDRAMKAYKQAVAVSPQHAKAFNNMGTLFYDEKKYDQALEMFKKAVSLDPGNLDFMANVAVVEKLQMKIGNESTTVATTSSKTRIPKMFYLRQERDFIQKNDISSAISILEKALHEYPKDATFLNDIAVLYLSRGDNVKAEAYLLQATSVDGTDSFLYFGLGNALEGQNKKADAERAYRMALKLDPNFLKARQALQKLGAKNF